MALHTCSVRVGVLQTECRVIQISTNVPGVSEYTRLEKRLEPLNKLLKVLLLDRKILNLCYNWYGNLPLIGGAIYERTYLIGYRTNFCWASY